MRVAVIGGGVIGLMQARELAQKGWDVVLIDKGEFGREASWAGGGIISPLYPWRYSDAVTQLASWSQSHYPELISRLHEESGIDPELSQHGLLMLKVEDQDKALSWSQHYSAWLESINHDVIYSLEPNLRTGVESALWMSRVASVRNPRLLRSLKTIVEQASNITLKVNSPVEHCIEQSGKLVSVQTQSCERVEADAFVFCAGAWSSKLLTDQTVEIQPVKGQMLVFDAQPGLVNRVVLSDGKYVIPRKDGRVVVGSTLEYTDFDKTTDQQAKKQLSEMAINLFPKLAQYPITHHWAGLRPGSPQGVPYISRLPDLSNAFINAGHFRNGLVLAPASVRLATSLICGEEAPFDASAYQIGAART